MGFLNVQRPSRVFAIALVSAIGGLIFLASTFNNGNNWLRHNISSPIDSPGLLPVANALGKDLMLDVAPGLHPSVFAGASEDEVTFQHWIDQEIHCEDCLRLEIPDNGKKVGVAFSNQVGYDFDGAKKVTFFAMPEEEGAKVQFKAVGNDIDNGGATGVPADDVFNNQEFALTSQNVTLNQTWGYFEMSLDGVQDKLTDVKYPFALVLTQATTDPTIVYIKGITYSADPVQDQYLLQASSVDNMTASTMALTSNATTPLNVTLSDNATETVNPPATVKFDTTVANGEEPYSFSWDFGDGTRETRTDGNKVHTFDTEGLYNVTVDVIDSLNSTGSANTLVNVTEKNTGSEPAIASEGNLTQEPQTTESANRTNTTTTTAAQDNNNNNTETSNNREGTNSPSADVNNNSPPIANAGNDITGKPNEKVTLDATKSTDPDEGDMIESYQWKQESGPAAKINNKNSPTPIVTLPDVNKDATLVFSLTVNDGTVDSDKQDTISIFVNHIDELSSDVQEKFLKPADTKSSQWILSDACKEQGEVECLSDGSGETFVSAGTDSVDDVNLYSFGQFTAGEGVDVNSLVIDRVTAEISAQKAGNTGYLSFVIDDPTKEEHYITPSISIASNNSFQKYDYAWDTNPVTGEKWTADSLNSLVAGFKYDGGQSGVQISELQLTISYHLPKPLPANDTTTGEAAANDNSQANPNENSSERDSTSATPQNTEQQEPSSNNPNENSSERDSTSATPQNTEQQEPSSNTDNKNSTSPSADENDSSPEE